MDEKNLQLLISIFKDEKGAEKAIETLKAAHKDAESGIQAAVAVIKDQNSAIHYRDVGLTPAKGALGGVILGATLGILTGGVGIALGALGAFVGGLIGNRKREQQFSSVRINELVASLVPGTSALVAVVELEHVADLEKGLESFEAEIFTAEVSADLAEKLDSQRHAAYTDWIEKLG